MNKKQQTDADIAELARRQDYERATLEHWAELIVGIVPFARGSLSKPTSPMRPLGLSDYQRRQLADYLRRLARTPAVIEALTTRRKGRGKPPTKAKRNWIMSLDYERTTERIEIEKKGRMGSAVRAQKEIGAAYKISKSVMLEAHSVCSSWAPWKHWAQYECNTFELEHPSMERGALLRAHSMKLRNENPDNSPNKQD